MILYFPSSARRFEVSFWIFHLIIDIIDRLHTSATYPFVFRFSSSISCALYSQSATDLSILIALLIASLTSNCLWRKFVPASAPAVGDGKGKPSAGRGCFVRSVDAVDDNDDELACPPLPPTFISSVRHPLALLPPPSFFSLGDAIKASTHELKQESSTLQPLFFPFLFFFLADTMKIFLVATAAAAVASLPGVLAIDHHAHARHAREVLKRATTTTTSSSAAAAAPTPSAVTSSSAAAAGASSPSPSVNANADVNPSLLTISATGVPALSQITSAMPSDATVALSTTFQAGATPPISGAPALPTCACASLLFFVVSFFSELLCCPPSFFCALLLTRIFLLRHSCHQPCELSDDGQEPRY